MKNYVALIFLLLNIALSVSGETQPGYSWRDFDGDVPDDAFVAGVDNKGFVYVGQVLFEGKIIPGKLHKNDYHIYFEYEEKARTHVGNIKILCAAIPDDLEWIPTTGSEFNQIKHLHLIKGGYQKGFLTYIGLAVSNGEVNVGKVICKVESCLAMYAEKNGRNVEYSKYYVLAYNPVEYEFHLMDK